MESMDDMRLCDAIDVCKYSILCCKCAVNTLLFFTLKCDSFFDTRTRDESSSV